MRIWQRFEWRTKDGRTVRIGDMGDEHLVNTVKYLRRMDEKRQAALVMMAAKKTVVEAAFRVRENWMLQWRESGQWLTPDRRRDEDRRQRDEERRRREEDSRREEERRREQQVRRVVQPLAFGDRVFQFEPPPEPPPEPVVQVVAVEPLPPPPQPDQHTPRSWPRLEKREDYRCMLREIAHRGLTV